MSGKAGLVAEMECFDRVDLASGHDGSYFGCGPESSSIVGVVEDECPVDVPPADFLPCPPIFSNAFKFAPASRARFRGLSAPATIDLSGLRC